VREARLCKIESHLHIEQMNIKMFACCWWSLSKELPSPILRDVDLKGFEDTRSQMLAYYVGMWFEDCRASKHDRRRLYDIYLWLIREKPTLEGIFRDSRCPLILHYMNLFGAEDVALLNDIRLTMAEWEKEKKSSAGFPETSPKKMKLTPLI